MLWIITFGIIGLISAIRFIQDWCEGFFPWFFGVIGIVVFTVIMALVGCLPALIFGIPFEKQWVETEQVKLLSLRSADGVKGNFFLGSGSIGTKQYYFFYKEKGVGYQPGKVEANGNVIVYEEEGRHDGLIKTYKKEFTSTFWVSLIAQTWPSERYDFFIPVGSLKKDFILQ